jgi:hypothetical protein
MATNYVAHRTAAGAPSKLAREDSLLCLCGGDRGDGGELRDRPAEQSLCAGCTHAEAPGGMDNGDTWQQSMRDEKGNDGEMRKWTTTSASS